MPTWNPNQYLKFVDERTQPCRDLAVRISVPSVQTVVDLGCGPGNSTAVLAARWPNAKFLGIDSSPEMIAAAKRSLPEHDWIVDDIASWADHERRTFDVVFANAALQWVPDHALLYPKLFARVAAGGALAVQVPGNWDAPAHRVMRELAASSGWHPHFPEGAVREWHVHDTAFYYDMLASRASRLDLWETEYIHIMPDTNAIAEWYRGTGLRPFLDALHTETERTRFFNEYCRALAEVYLPRPDGRVLFPFRRLFLVAYRA
jgi:trans-aconitate 2-methyltransferase